MKDMGALMKQAGALQQKLKDAQDRLAYISKSILGQQNAQSPVDA